MKNKDGNENINEIAEWLEQVRFRKQFFGGVSEQDVWKKMNELNDMYENALKSERVRYDTLIEQYKNDESDKEKGELAHDD